MSVKSFGKITTSWALQTWSMFSVKDLISQPSGIWKRLVRTIPRSSLQGKTLLVSHFSTVPAVDSAVPIPGIRSIFANMTPIVEILQMIPTKRYPATIQVQHQPLNWTVPALSTVPTSAGYYFYSTPIRKSKGTSHCSINSKSFINTIIQSHCCFRWKQLSPQ